MSVETLWDALDGRYKLAPELETIDWRGRRVILVPPSTIETNKRIIWDTYFLGRLLTKAGAFLKVCRLPDNRGRMQTLTGFLKTHDFGEITDYLVDPLLTRVRSQNAVKQL